MKIKAIIITILGALGLNKAVAQQSGKDVLAKKMHVSTKSFRDAKLGTQEGGIF